MNHYIRPGVGRPKKREFFKTIVPADKVLRVVTEHFYVPFEKMQARTRKREICFPRQVAMFFLYKYSLKSHEDVASLFDRDRTTAMNAIGVVNDLMESDPSVLVDISVMESKILTA